MKRSRPAERVVERGQPGNCTSAKLHVTPWLDQRLQLERANCHDVRIFTRLAGFSTFSSVLGRTSALVADMPTQGWRRALLAGWTPVARLRDMAADAPTDAVMPVMPNPAGGDPAVSGPVGASAPRWPVVLFDLDGTLVNTVPLIVASYRVAFREVLDREVDEDWVRPYVGRTLDDVFAELGLPVEPLITAYRRFNLANLERLQLDYDGVPEMLKRLREAGVTLGVVTSKNRPTAERSLAASGLSGMVELVTAQADTELHKPNPDPLLHALGHLGRRAQECVYVGDSVWDLEAAHAAGMAAIGVSWGAALRPALEGVHPDAVVDTPAELLGLLLPHRAE